MLTIGRKTIGTLLVLMAAAFTSQAQTFTVLHEFSTSDPRPAGTLAQGEDGSFYAFAGDALFAFNPVGGAITDIPVVMNGDNPTTGLVMGVDGSFYGTTNGGGNDSYGTIFRVKTDGTANTLYSFDGNDGFSPFGQLIQGTDGNLYGTTEQGAPGTGCRGGCGVVYQLNIVRGLYTVLHQFVKSPNDGASPYGGLVQATDGNFYGTTAAGGTNGKGTVFKITRKGVLTILHNFNGSDGEGPEASLLQGSDGYFYGSTIGGGTNGAGTLFKVDSTGQLTTLHSFDYTDGNAPASRLTQASDGNFYGVTLGGGIGTHCVIGYGCGALFSVDSVGDFQKLHDFLFDDGISPSGGLLQATNGVFYGLTIFGGSSNCDNGYGCGTLYSFDMGLPPFVTFPRAAGRIGKSGPILGQGFTGTTSVAINGVSAPFTVVSDTHLQVTIPPGATTGYVTVTTPNGVLTSNVPFHVLP